MSHSKRFCAVVLTGLFGALMPFVSTQAATYTPQEQANMKLVADFYAALDEGNLQQRIRGIAEQYLKEDYNQHSELGRASGAGREGFIRSFQQMPSGPPPGAGAPPPAGSAGLPPPTGAAPPAGRPPRGPAKVFILSAQGDLVVRVSALGMPAPGGDGANSVIFNMFRIQGGKLAEHWDSTNPGMMPGGPRGAGGPPGAAEKPR